jgi:hypothetical protein
MSARAERRGREADAGVVEDRGEFGGPFAGALVADFAGEVAAGAADEVLGDALGEGAPGQRALPGAGRGRAVRGARGGLGGLGEFETGDSDAFPDELVVLAGWPPAGVVGLGLPF